MRRFLLILLIMSSCFLPSCTANAEKGLTPSYSAQTTTQWDAESINEKVPITKDEPKGIELTFGAKDCAVYSLGELVKMFTSLGFSDIEIIPCELTAVEIQKDKVLAVLVDGDADFKKAAVYPKEAKIRILYAVFTYDASVPETDAVTETEVGETTETPVTETVIDEADVIYVYVTESGSRYHTKPDCSDMKAPQKLSLAAAEALNYSPCKRCGENGK